MKGGDGRSEVGGRGGGEFITESVIDLIDLEKRYEKSRFEQMHISLVGVLVRALALRN